MSHTHRTRPEVGDSITGHDELAVEQHLGFDIYAIVGKQPAKYRRALIFIHLRHEGLSDEEAKKAALDLSIGEAWDYFAEVDEIDPEEPDTEAGKDSSPAESVPPTSPGSASSPE